MSYLMRSLRALAKLRFRWLGLATIKDIPTSKLNELVRALQRDGWRIISEYDGLDAWSDHGLVRLRRGSTRLKLEWDYISEGRVEGPRSAMEELGRTFGLEVTDTWGE